MGGGKAAACPIGLNGLQAQLHCPFRCLSFDPLRDAHKAALRLHRRMLLCRRPTSRSYAQRGEAGPETRLRVFTVCCGATGSGKTTRGKSQFLGFRSLTAGLTKPKRPKSCTLPADDAPPLDVGADALVVGFQG